jgi:hypothetical protein
MTCEGIITAEWHWERAVPISQFVWLFPLGKKSWTPLLFEWKKETLKIEQVKCIIPAYP